ncbi:MAG: type II toxin-antitoxin system RelE/ParE family toxin [Candidatus Competibacteraceae bacterium]|nr:type II toxin-antitoxin system RelE/ParE family toxin [Candidatus Competibacteraceae bacterium]
MTLRFRNEALSDLEEIGDYIATDNPLKAESFVAELRAHCERLLPNPRIHPVRRSLPGNVRVAPHGNYLIIYREIDDALEIVRIFHGARNIDELF